MRRRRLLSPTLLALASLLAACGTPPAGPAKLVVNRPADAGPGLRDAVADLVHDLGKISGRKVTTAALPAPECTDGEVHVLALGSTHDESGRVVKPTLGAQQYTLDETRCGENGRRIVLEGGSVLAGQWAIYDLMRRLGVRYLHPEQTFYPKTLKWPAAELHVKASPAFRRRDIHAHTTHPIELSPPLDASGLDMKKYQEDWIAWNVKMRQTSVDGWDASIVGTYAYDRGFPRTAWLNLLETQQGGVPVINPDNPAPEHQQIADAIDARMKHVDGLPDVTRFGFTFNPTEFTTADDQKTVDRLDFIAGYMKQHDPGVDLYTIDHGTHEGPTPHYGVRFFDLPGLAPANLGVEVHPLMFYGLDRPAPVYGNQSFAFLRRFIEAQAPKRRIVYYPESAWWLTFDEPVPLYLAPVTLEARQDDFDRLAPLLAKTDDAPHGVYGIELFSSGQEWGYWMNDWCVARMAWDLKFTAGDCLDDFTSLMADGKVLRQVLAEVTTHQVNEMRNPDLLRFLVGSDDQTEAAAQVGVVFHPLPPQPKAVLADTDAEAAALETYSLEPLSQMADRYDAWAKEVAATLPDQDARQAPWVRELHDGLAIFGLRARHAVTVYRTVLALRAALKTGDVSAIHAAAAGVDRARALTDAARQIVRAREKDYRYPPALTIAGDEPGTPGALKNRTIYPYRYLSRTHRLFYWTRPDDELAALFGEGLDVVGVSQRILSTGQALTVKLLTSGVTAVQVDWGDGTTSPDLAPHTYTDPGFHTWVLDATTAAGPVHHQDDAVQVDRRLVFPKGSLKVKDPGGAAIVDGLLPGFVVGLGDDGTPFLALGRLDGKTEVAAAGSLLRRARTAMVSGPADLTLGLKKVGTLTVHDATLTLGDGTGPAKRTLKVQGTMVTQDVIDLLVSAGGFDTQGARKMVAELLGYTADTLPDQIPFTLTATGHDG